MEGKTGSIPMAELERRMRPGAWSGGGFLGPSESLEAVVDGDRLALGRLGLSHGELAMALEDLVRAALDQRMELLRTDVEQYRRREAGIPDLYTPGQVPTFGPGSLPGTEVGYLVGGRWQVFIVQYRGLQECPWECDNEPWSSFDFLILNRETGESVTGPGLMVHLVREHHFFEGQGSPYRTDPARLARVLELAGGHDE